MEKVGLEEKSDEDLRVKHKSGRCNTHYFWIIIVLLGINQHHSGSYHAYGGKFPGVQFSRFSSSNSEPQKLTTQKKMYYIMQIIINYVTSPAMYIMYIGVGIADPYFEHTETAYMILVMALVITHTYLHNMKLTVLLHSSKHWWHHCHWTTQKLLYNIIKILVREYVGEISQFCIRFVHCNYIIINLMNLHTYCVPHANCSWNLTQIHIDFLVHLDCI